MWIQSIREYLSSVIDKQRRTFALLVLLGGLVACNPKPEGERTPAESMVIPIVQNAQATLLLGDTGGIYCIAGHLKGPNPLKAGQCLKKGHLYTFRIADLVSKFPRYNTPEVQKAVEKQNADNPEGKDHPAPRSQ